MTGHVGAPAPIRLCPHRRQPNDCGLNLELPVPLPAYELRRFVYDRIVEAGTPPRSEEIGAHFGVDAATARASLAELRIGKTVLVYPPPDGEIWMAGPFSAARRP